MNDINREDKYILGLDTSNYTTSVGVTDLSGNILFNGKIVLNVKNGERGLRQSDALFQHWNNIPLLLRKMKKELGDIQISAVSVSDKPRPVEGSYMPVFLAGINLAQSISLLNNIPLFRFSHQEGHIKAALHKSLLENSECFISYHMSGGTSELLLVRESGIDIIGGTKDISFGQVIDRIGVACGFDFPSGPYLDEIVCRHENDDLHEMKKIRYTDLYFNLSGLETQALRIIKENSEKRDDVFYEVFDKISKVIIETSSEAAIKYKASGILFVGGVSSSLFFRQRAESAFSNMKITYAFGEKSLSSDNAVGVSLLGGTSLRKSLQMVNKNESD